MCQAMNSERSKLEYREILFITYTIFLLINSIEIYCSNVKMVTRDL